MKRRLIDWALGVGRQGVSKLRAARASRVPPCSALQHRLADRLVYSKVKARLGGKLRIGDLGRRAAREGDRGVLPRARHPHPRGLRPDRVHDRGDRQPPDALPLRHRRAGAPRHRAAHRRRRRGADQVADTVFAGLLQGRGGDRARSSATTAGCAPATSASIDEDGFLTITDRKKDIIVTAGGKNVAPQNLENELKASKFVSQALVVGDRQPYSRR